MVEEDARGALTGMGIPERAIDEYVDQEGDVVGFGLAADREDPWYWLTHRRPPDPS
jgi:hypothetical protein